ncbi:adhesin transport system membrane fusion protein [Dongia mobilis]|uniref:Membrane fusion protein (MFP) family protein n=1 Tax=Dongia mobilis TaxID=578943 RepID=A0A4R6WLP9_9PROT|nr:HlyD family type I secretion periplasmic adaptor subunit [Dongia mobilis]TDQ81496.1 adhesin transport system membrane fusion protein [Dongia mobilis]
MTLALDSLRRDTRSSGWSVLAMISIGLICAFVVWATVAEFDQFSIAQGEVAPADKVKVIQHLEGGSIAAIFVTDGQVVTAGSELVAVELGLGGANREELQARLDSLALLRARLLAESSDQPLTLPADVAQRRPDLAAAEQSAYSARQTELANRIESAQQRVRQQELAVSELQATFNATVTDLDLAGKNLAMSQDLLRDGLTSKMEHLAREREAKLLEGKVSALRSSLPKARAALDEARANLNDEKLKFNRAAFEELGKVEQDISSTNEMFAEADTQASRKIIRAPVDGIVKNLRFHTIGGVIGPGDPIMEIVPVNESVVIEARLRPEDSGVVEMGQPVRIKISAYDFTRFGTLSGTLTYISADSVADDEGNTFFQVLVTPDKSYLGETPGEYPIRPGMTATVDIRTGTRTVIEFLLKPVMRLRYDSLREG